MKKCTRCVSSHFKKHGIKYVLGVSALIVAKWVVSLILWVGFFNLTAHASYDPATVCASISDIPPSECYVLVDLYNATDGDNWGNAHRDSCFDWRCGVANSGWLQWTTVCSNWKWVLCQDGNVTQLTVMLQTWINSSSSIDVTWLPYLINLRLNDLGISSINISGLSLLLWLDLSHNALTTIELPVSGTAYFLNNGINLSYNQLESIMFPPDMTWQGLNLNHNNLTELHLPSPQTQWKSSSLDVGNNPLTILDITWTDFSTLLWVSFEWTHLSMDFSQFSDIQSLNLSGCWLSDLSVLTWISSNIQQLILSNNELAGIFDANAFPSLTSITVMNNQLEWIHADEVVGLQWIEANNNNITMDNLILPPSVRYLYLDNNDFSGVVDFSAWPLTNLSISDNHITQLIMNNHTMERLTVMNNDLTTFDFRWFDNYQGDFWIGGNQFSGTLEEMWICDLPFTGNNELLDCRNAYNMWETLRACHKIQLNGMNLYGDIPECLTQFNDTLISLWYNRLSLYNSSGEIKYSPELIAWLNDYSVWDSQRWPNNWMDQSDTPERTSDLYIFPTITTQWTISLWDTIEMTIDFWTFGPGITIPGSTILLSFGGLEDIVSSTGSSQTSRWVAGDICYDQYLQGTWVYAQALDEGGESLYNQLGEDNGDGTMTLHIGKWDPIVITITPQMLNSHGLSKYFALLAEVLWVMWNIDVRDQILAAVDSSWAYVAFEFMCKAWVFNDGEWYATMAECLQSPRTPNTWEPIQLSWFAWCGIWSWFHTLWGMSTRETKFLTVSAKVVGNITIWASIINAGTEFNLWDNYSYLTLNLDDQKIVGSSGYVNLTISDSSGVVIARDSVASSSWWSVEVPADTTIVVSGTWDGALYAPMDTNAVACSLPVAAIKTFTVGATWDTTSLVASWWYFKIEVTVGNEYNNDTLAIYVTNGAPCVLNSPDPICVVSGGICGFRASHLSDFSLVVNTEGQNSWNNNQWWNTSPSWWGSPTLQKDVCPEKRDCSTSYYDALCGPCTSPTIIDKIVNLFHKDAPAVPASIVWSTYSDELNSAYVWSYNLWITTIPTIQKANIEWTLLRSHLAKMLSQYAINVLGLKENTWANCIFNDMTTQSKEMQYYAIQACRLGLMWIGITNFSPEKEVDRATFGTTLSRALYGTGNDVKGSRYYGKHLQALKDAGIMTKITSPFAKEIRGYVMLMLQRAEALVDASE